MRYSLKEIHFFPYLGLFTIREFLFEIIMVKELMLFPVQLSTILYKACYYGMKWGAFYLFIANFFAS